MTLHSYQYDSNDYHRRAGGRGAVTVKGGRWQRFRQKFTRKRVILGILAILLLGGGWLGFKFADNLQKIFGGNIFDLLHSTRLRGEDRGRVNILLAGNSADDPGHGGANLTDSIMLVSIDTRQNKAFMLSIPRDLWVHISGDGHQKINNAYIYGQSNGFNQDGYPAGGMGQLEQVVSQDLGIPIDYYALIDYTAIRDAVNAVGGIDVNIQSCDARGLYDPNRDYATNQPLVRLSNGWHHLNGEQALDLARARGDPSIYGYSYGFCNSDFTRTANQRQMLAALKNKTTSAGVLANPDTLSKLADALGNNVKTDFKLNEVRRLISLTQKINNGNIQSLSLDKANGKNLLQSYAAPDGESALIPAAGLDNFSAIQAFIRQKTSSNAVTQEGATVTVLNGTTINGLALKVERQLSAKQILVSGVGDAPVSSLGTTAIIDTSGGKKPATAGALVKLFGSHLTTQNVYGLSYDSDFIVVLGRDRSGGVITAANTTGQ